jgi:putative flippase GtrA
MFNCFLSLFVSVNVSDAYVKVLTIIVFFIINFIFMNFYFWKNTLHGY